MKSSEELQQLYDQSYVKRYQRIQSFDRIARLLRYIDLSPTDNIVDFACGDGMLMPLVAPHVNSYTGVDFSSQFIEAASARATALELANYELVCSSIENFARDRPDAYDVGFAMDFAEHVYDEEWGSILSSCRTTLKAGGRLYLHTPNADFFIEKMKKREFILHQFPDHVAVRSPEENVALLESAGFEINQLQLVEHYNVLKYLHPLSHLPIAGKYFEARIFIEAVKP